jgi:hypothetical protein
MRTIELTASSVTDDCIMRALKPTGPLTAERNEVAAYASDYAEGLL